MTATTRLSAFFRKYLAVTKISYRNRTTYVANAFFRALTVVARVWIFSQLYRVTFAVAGTDTIGGLDYAQTVWLLTLTQAFMMSGRPASAKVIDEEVKSGATVHAMSKPYSYPTFHPFLHLGRYVSNLTISLAFNVATVLILVGPISFSFQGLAAGAVLLFFGVILDFLISSTIGLLAFWFEDALPFIWVYQKAQLVFGGNIVPLTVFPSLLYTIAVFSPFAQFYYNPAYTMIDFSAGGFARGLILQLVWVIVAAGISLLIYRLSMKKVFVHGG